MLKTDQGTLEKKIKWKAYQPPSTEHKTPNSILAKKEGKKKKKKKKKKKRKNKKNKKNKTTKKKTKKKQRKNKIKK